MLKKDYKLIYFIIMLSVSHLIFYNIEPKPGSRNKRNFYILLDFILENKKKQKVLKTS